MRLSSLATLVLTLVCMPTVSFAKAGTQEFSDPIAFADAVKNRFSIGFNGIRPVGSPYQSFGSLSVCGVNFSTPTAGAFVNVTAADYYDPNTYPGDVPSAVEILRRLE